MFKALKNKRTANGLAVRTGDYVSVDRDAAFKANEKAIQATIMPKIRMTGSPCDRCNGTGIFGFKNKK